MLHDLCAAALSAAQSAAELASPRHPYGDPDAITKRMRAVFQRSTSVSYLLQAASSM